MATISKLNVGQVIYDKHKYKMGNTTIRTWGLWTVKVLEIDTEFRWIKASWNGNQAKTYYQTQVSKWKVKKPQMPDSRW